MLQQTHTPRSSTSKKSDKKNSHGRVHCTELHIPGSWGGAAVNDTWPVVAMRVCVGWTTLVVAGGAAVGGVGFANGIVVSMRKCESRVCLSA